MKKKKLGKAQLKKRNNKQKFDMKRKLEQTIDPNWGIPFRYRNWFERKLTRLRDKKKGIGLAW